MAGEGGGAPGGPEDGATDPDSGRPGALDLLRSALVNDDDRRIPWWLPLPGLGIALAWASYEGTVGGGFSVFLSTALWPGAGLFLFGTIATVFGWQLDID
jgi:hypothetical protein